MADTLTITDNRTGKSYEVAITDGTIKAADLRQIGTSAEDFGLMSYDPAFMNTASCRSAITYLDGDAGILRYRGYPIEQLAEHSTYLEVAYLLLHGELPDKTQLADWQHSITTHTFVHEFLKRALEGYRYDAHPMGRLVAFLATLSTFYGDAKEVRNPEIRKQHIVRIIAKMPTIAAWAYRHSLGRPYIYPNNELSYPGNFLAMLFQIAEPKYTPHPIMERALDVLFILHADHEQNCSTSAARGVGSAESDPYVSLAAASAALYGPLHGGANEAVLRMLKKIGNVKNVPDFIKSVKAGEGKLMGFGHRVYKNYDPRAKVIKKLADEVFEVTGKNPLLDIALELERIALSDDYFIKRKLYPNVDFYSGLIYQAMKFPVEMFPVLFAIPRASGWLSQWNEMLDDPEQKIARPRQVYTGVDVRDYVPLDKRGMIEEYARLSIHRWMLLDEVRNEAYRQAILRVVRPGDVVLDMGAGTGILSIFAAQAGAKRVHAVERTDISIVARQLIARNGFSDVIEVHHTDLEDVVLPDKVDVIVSEWMGAFGVDENMLAPLVMARDRWLKDGGKIIPERVTAMLAPMWVVELDDAVRHWGSRPHGVDLALINELTANETVMTQWAVTPDDLLAAPQAMWSHDAHRCSLAVADATFESKQVFVASRDGKLSSLAAWFHAEMCDGVALTNAVGAKRTHWGRLMLPLTRTIEVRTGATIRTEIRCEPAAQGSSELYWSVQIDDGPIERHDTRPRRAAAFAAG